MRQSRGCHLHWVHRRVEVLGGIYGAMVEAVHGFVEHPWGRLHKTFPAAVQRHLEVPLGDCGLQCPGSYHNHSLATGPIFRVRLSCGGPREKATGSKGVGFVADGLRRTRRSRCALRCQARVWSRFL